MRKFALFAALCLPSLCLAQTSIGGNGATVQIGGNQPGVSSIQGTTGDFTFTGSGFSGCTTTSGVTTCTFTGSVGTLTTVGDSGLSSLSSGILNIPANHGGNVYGFAPFSSLVGAFTDSSGNVLQPIYIGNGPATFAPPLNATQLQLGVNDNEMTGTTGSWTVSVNGTNYTVDGRSFPWLHTAGINSQYPTGSTSGGIAPTIVPLVNGVLPVTIQYVSGIVTQPNEITGCTSSLSVDGSGFTNCSLFADSGTYLPGFWTEPANQTTSVAGVTSIDTLTGAFTFSGSGVSHSGNAYTFSGSGLSGQTTNYLPKATSATASTTSSIIEDQGTGVVIHGTSTTNGAFWPASSGTPSPIASDAGIGSDASGNLIGSDNGGTFARVCTATNGVCPTGSSGLSGMTSGQVPIAATATTVTSSKALAGSGTGITTGPTTSTNLDCAQFSGTTGQIADSGAPCGTGSGSGTLVNLAGWAAQPTPPSTTLLQAVNNAANQAVNIVVAGDSFTIVDQTNSTTGPLVSTNRWAEQIRIQLQAIYGSHGTGMVPFVLGFGPASGNTEEYTSAGTTTVDPTVLGPLQTSFQTGSSILHLHSGASFTFLNSRNIKWDTLHVYGAAVSGMGTLTCVADGSTSLGAAFSVSNAGASGAVASGYTASRWDSSTIALAAHTATCTASGDFYFYGLDGTAGSTGVEVSMIGIGGSAMEAWGTNATDELAFTDLMNAGTQAFILMGQTNDVAHSVATGTFSTQIQNVITHEQALASAPMVMLAVPPVDTAASGAAPYTAVQLGLCTTNSLTCVNIQDRGNTSATGPMHGWGTTFDATTGLWSADNIHPNDKGNLDEAQLIYARLVNPLSGFGAQAADSVVMNATASTAVPTAVAMPVCAGPGNADLYSTATHTWSCVSTGSGSSGAVTLLESHTASASAALLFTGWQSSSYDTYIIKIEHLIPTSSGDFFYLRCSTNGGTSYDASASYSSNEWGYRNAGGSGSGAGDTAIGIELGSTGAGVGVDGTSLLGLTGTINMTQVSGNYVGFDGTLSAKQGSGDPHYAGYAEAGTYRVSSPICNAFEIVASGSGHTIASGTVRIYGVAH